MIMWSVVIPMDSLAPGNGAMFCCQPMIIPGQLLADGYEDLSVAVLFCTNLLDTVISVVVNGIQ